MYTELMSYWTISLLRVGGVFMATGIAIFFLSLIISLIDRTKRVSNGLDNLSSTVTIFGGAICIDTLAYHLTPIIIGTFGSSTTLLQVTGLSAVIVGIIGTALWATRISCVMIHHAFAGIPEPKTT